MATTHAALVPTGSPEPTGASTADTPVGARPVEVAIGVGLVLAVLAAYESVRGFGFVNVDDQQYVYENPLVARGLTWDGVAAAFSQFRAGNWHPLAFLSHMLDVELFGLDAGWHHVVNVVLHAANAILVFSFLRRASGATWRSAAVAALFALHPLHVESVAWISERKDVLSTLFFLIALHAYLWYARRPRPTAYLALLGLFALGLLSKPMVVTLPFVLLLLDAWPLERWTGAATEDAASDKVWKLVREKIPLFALSAIASVVAWRAQAAGEAPIGLARIPIDARLANAALSYGTYLWDTIWPASLATFYPHPALSGIDAPAWRVGAATVALLAITAIAIHERRRRPFIAFGWLFYLGTLVPVIGIAQVGAQSHADRYTYVPLVGVFVAIAWLAGEQAARFRLRHATIAVGSVAVVLALTAVARAQVATWRDSETLHRHALAHTDRNWNAWVGLGDALSGSGRPQDAIGAYAEAARLRPELAQPWNGLGVAYGRLGQHERALAPLEQAVRMKPSYAEAWYNLGTAFGSLGRHADAARCFRAALGAKPDDVRAWANLGIASILLGDRRGAEESHEALRRLDPARARALRAQLEAAGL